MVSVFLICILSILYISGHWFSGPHRHLQHSVAPVAYAISYTFWTEVLLHLFELQETFPISDPLTISVKEFFKDLVVERKGLNGSLLFSH